MFLLRAPLLILVMAALTLSGVGQPTAQAANHVILKVHGKIAPAHAGKSLELDFAALEQIGRHTITTDTKWTDGVNTFEGPLLRDVLDHIGASGTSIRATAINDYEVDIPISDAIEHDVILAHTMNGKRMRIRDKGPLWVIYPWRDNPDLADERIYSRSIWQLDRIEIR